MPEPTLSRLLYSGRVCAGWHDANLTSCYVLQFHVIAAFVGRNLVQYCTVENSTSHLLGTLTISSTFCFLYFAMSDVVDHAYLVHRN